jgi:predicted DCC family thiol-disulfide oxidoreductase YuxK
MERGNRVASLFFMTTFHAIVLFDGVCNLCTGTVKFIVPRDPHGYFQFASLQSPVGQQLLERYHASTTALDSVALIQDGHIYFKSDAALRMARQLGGILSLAWVIHYVPRSLRDWAYDWLAAHRYQFFGKRDTCLINIPSNAERFLDTSVSVTQ